MSHDRSHRTQGFDWCRFMIPESVSSRITTAATRDGLDRGEWLHRAVAQALERSEGVRNHG